MDTYFAALFDASIQIELHAAALYFQFHKWFPEDSYFWWELVLEEKGHAALIRSGKDFFAPIGKFPHDLLGPVLQELLATNRRLLFLVNKYTTTKPTREEAFALALEIETSAGELHFQEFMDKKVDSSIHETFQELNRADHDHWKRIIAYMEMRGIRLPSAKALHHQTGLPEFGPPLVLRPQHQLLPV